MSKAKNLGKTENHTPTNTNPERTTRSEEKRKIQPTRKHKTPKTIPCTIGLDKSLLTEVEKQAIEEVLVENHDMFCRYRMENGMNTEFKLKLTFKHYKAVYNQNLPRRIHRKDDQLVDLSFMHNIGIITVLPFSNYASPIFAQRKPNGKLCLLVDLRRINSLVADDYTRNNHPVSTLSDEAQHLAGKTLFCQLVCSQACHCLQMADQGSTEMLAFNLASKTFA